MDSKKAKDLMRKHKKPRPPSSSDSSSSSDSDSGSSSDSFSSSSSSKKPIKRKIKRIRSNRRSSSSSDEERSARKREKHACHKKLEAKKNHLKRKLKEAKAKKRALSPSMRRRTLSPSQKIKKMALSSIDKKHHILSAKERMREKEREREREQREREKDREREKEREKLRARERERVRSRSPKTMKSRSPKPPRGRESKRKSPVEKHHNMSPREKLICQIRRDRSPIDRKKEIRRRHDDSRERERRERERAEREAARNKEREEALARCQERQRERERLAREKLRREKEKDYKGDRLLPRPAEREMAIAAARGSSRERSLERDPHRSHPHTHSRPSREPVYERGYEREREYVPHEHRVEKEERRDHDREYLVVRRRELESPLPTGTHYTAERVRGAELEMYVEEPKYEREHTYISRNYASPVNETHRREANWDREHDIPREREIEHGKLYPPERPPASSRNWVPVEEKWRAPQKDQWEENWPRNEAPEENWDGEESFRPRPQHEWEDPRMKHEAHREEHPPTQPHAPRRWPQEWRGRPIEERPGHQPPIQPAFHHSAPPPVHQIEYPHERTEPIYPNRRQHPLPKPLMQQHIPHPGNYHIRPHFPSKRQMTYINPNVVNQNAAHNISKISTALTQTLPPAVSQSNHVTIQPVVVTNSLSADKPTFEILQDKVKEKQDQNMDTKMTTVTSSKEAEYSTNQLTSGEEPTRDDLSEISDDADEFLNKDEDGTKAENEENWDSDSNGVPEIDLKNDENNTFVKSNEDEKKLDESTSEVFENKEETQSLPVSIQEETVKQSDQETKEISDDILDFEEISDGELEEDARTKNLSDALGVDWASLVEESKFRQIPIEKHTTAKQKWQPHRVILDVGISFKYAGEEFAKKLINDAKLTLSREEECKTDETMIDVKMKEEEDIIISNDMDMKIPISEIKLETKENIKEELSKPAVFNLACIQVAEQKKELTKKNLIFNACGSNSRALSARKDLKLRRQLCELPIKEIGYIQRPVSNHLKSLALKAFGKTLTEVH